MKELTRRDLLGASILGLALSGEASAQPTPARPMRIVIAGAHPDDPETAAGGTMALLADKGHEVFALYLTRGEPGIRRKTHDQAAAIRTAEAIKACEILKAKPVFAGQIDGSTELNPARYEQFRSILLDLKPDIAMTHWPVDTHRDHRAVSLLTYDAWLMSKKSFALYYFEVETGSQTQLFHPTHYVDITSTESRKREACFAHVSQAGPHFYDEHDAMNRFRGMEHGCKFAEAFVHHNQGPGGMLRMLNSD
jgi:LmbE family N-acetylglucosaminyl deacetylase